MRNHLAEPPSWTKGFAYKTLASIGAEDRHLPLLSLCRIPITIPPDRPLQQLFTISIVTGEKTHFQVNFSDGS
jgi:hypothetical protein